MKQYDSIPDYISDVKQYIHWKRARKIATKELEFHIQDQQEAFISQGYCELDALRAAIDTMGSAEKIGNELNRVYRPKINVPIISITVLFILSGVFITALAGGDFSVTKGIAVLLGAVLAFALYWCDYTVFIRFPRTIYFVHLLITAIVLLFESRNSFSLISYNYTSYLILLSPITLAGISLCFRTQQTPYGLLYFAIYASIPLIGAFLLSSIPTISILVITDIVMLVYGFRKKRFSTSCMSIISFVCFILMLAGILISLKYFLHIPTVSPHNPTEFIQNVIREMVHDTSVYGDASFVIQNRVEQLIMTDYPITILLLKFGYLVVGGIVIIFSFLLILLYKISVQQKTDIGCLISLIVFFILSFQFICAIFCNFGIVRYFTMCLPFIASGGLFITYNLILIGIILSVSRHEDIAKSWISYKEKRGIYG